ncbi:hypothetical protein N9R81_01285 [Flavobacteriales bacterium]|nr:hypothetical protein [Flavobacteriales bacterium]
MKKNILPIVMLIVLAGISIYFYLTKSGSTLKPELTNYAVEDTAAISKIFLADKAGHTITLERKSTDEWTVNGEFTARQDGVKNLLDAMARVEIKAPVNKSAYETIVKRLSSAGVKVEIYTNGSSPEKVYYVGGSNQEHTGTEMLLEGSSTPHLTHIHGFYGFLTPRFFVNINEWRARNIFKYSYGEIAKIRVEHPMDPTESFEITDLGNNMFSLTDITNNIDIVDYDTLAVLDFISRFQRIDYEGFEETKTKQYIEDIKETTPQHIYSVSNKLGETKTCTTYLKPAQEGATDLEGNEIFFDMDRMYAAINDSDFVVIQHFVFDNLKKNLSDFR